MYKSSYPGGLKLPDLGPLDRAIYLTLIVVCILCTGGAVLAFLLVYGKVPFLSPEVIGFANNAGVLALAVACSIMVLFEILPLIGGFNRQYPIFGTAGVTYGAPEWTPVYPLFMPKAAVPEEIRPGLREARQTVCLMLVGLVLSAAIFGLSVFSGNRIHEDGSVHVLWGLGWEVQEYQPESVEEITVSIRKAGSTRRTTTPRYELFLELEMDDNRVYTFRIREFRNDGETSPVALMVNVLRCCPEADVIFENAGRLPDLIYDQQYNDREERLLEELFSGG